MSDAGNYCADCRFGGGVGGRGGECGKRTMRGLGDTMEGGVWCRGRHLTAYDAERERLP